MKNMPQQLTPPFVSPPGEARGDTLSERRSAAHFNDPSVRWQHGVGAQDGRPQLAAGGAPQRIRARQTEARTAVQCHVRSRRRPPI
jgi:hypothetical protein